MFNSSDLGIALKASPFAAITDDLVCATSQVLKSRRHGFMDRWIDILNTLPKIQPGIVDLDLPAPKIGLASDTDSARLLKLESHLKQLMPWRKGPFDLFGIQIDAEWRSDMKWQRLSSQIDDLTDRMILDIGCGNGYYMYRMLGAGARYVLGIDPSQLFNTQFNVFKNYLPEIPAVILPLRFEEFPFSALTAKGLQFDTLFSMGILYHRKNPEMHLNELSQCLRKGGQLVLETLIIEGDDDHELIPDKTYAKMPNVWSIPTESRLHKLLETSGFHSIKTLDITRTTIKEQRRTDWMNFESLADFLDSDDSGRTIEGYPGPVRIVISCKH